MQIGVRIQESWSWYKAVSMVGGTIRQKLIHRESFRPSVLQRTLATTRYQNHCTGIVCLDIAFVLIDGHPEKLIQFLSLDVLKWYHPQVSCRQREKYGRVSHPPLLQAKLFRSMSSLWS